ncbi:MAG: UbiA family prenyltransferase [Euryarchaeota archaeon]|nr:UbiA family prenyltransferase [Euryarchaeota archaeon]
MNVIRLKKRVKGFIDLIRPFTLLAPIIVSICIIFASFFYNRITEDIFAVLWRTIIPASFAMAILNGASNVLNQVTDIKSDKISRSYRPIPKGIVSIGEAKVISLFMYIIAICLSIYVNIIFSVFVFLITIFTVTYSVPPRLKDILFLNQLWVAIPRGLLGILASWSVFGNPLQSVPLAIGFIAMLFLIGGSITKDITDSDADRKTGTRTMINTFGVKKAAFISFPFMFFPFVIIPLLINDGILNSNLWLLTFLAIPSYFVFYLMINGKKERKVLENTSAWGLMYITYFVFAFGFSVLTIMGSVIS